MDYDVEMLRLYFKEKNFTQKQINDLLNKNPFNYNYIKWEQFTQKNNKIIAKAIKNMNLIDPSIQIQEVTNHKQNCLSKFLTNPCEIKTESINNINNVKINNKLLLMKFFCEKQKIILKKAEHFKIPFIVCIGNSNNNQTELFYQQIINEIKFNNIIEQHNTNNKIYILTKK